MTADPILCLVNACAAELRERGYEIVSGGGTSLIRADQIALYVQTDVPVDPRQPHKLVALTATRGGSLIVRGADAEALAVAFHAWLRSVQDLIEHNRLLDVYLGIEPKRSAA